MATLVEYVINRGEIRWTQTILGWTGVETMVVHSMTSPIIGSIDPANLVPAALQVPDLPDVFDVHEFVPAAFLLEKTGSVIDGETNAVEVRLQWGPLGTAVLTPTLNVGDPPELTIDGVVQDIETSFDRDGKEIAVSFTFVDPETNQETTKTYYPTITVAQPMRILNYRKLSYTSGVADQAKFMGKVNGVDFQGIPSGNALMSNVSTRIFSFGDEQQAIWETIYQIQIKDDQTIDSAPGDTFSGWAVFVVYRNPDGTVPTDEDGNVLVTFGNGIEVVFPYKKTDANGALLDFNEIFNP